MSSPLTARSNIDPYVSSVIYYGDSVQKKANNHFRTRTYSISQSPTKSIDRSGLKLPIRRGSHDEKTLFSQQFSVDVKRTLAHLHTHEDTDGNFQITIEDNGPKVISLGTASSNGYNKVELRGNYVISNLYQELHMAEAYGQTHVVLDEARLNENPVSRLSRLIKNDFWDNLTRVIDGSVIEKAGKDPKDWTDDPRPRIYVPRGAPEQFEYYNKVAADRPEIRLEVLYLPEKITPEHVRDMNAKPGLLAVAMNEVTDEQGNVSLKGVPFVVPGGRFNELYGWDSYMESLGLIENGKVELAKGMVDNFIFCIKHYGKILNATRSYYLCRSQPPFLTDMALRVFACIKHEPGANEWLRGAILAAMKEYRTVWMAEPRLDRKTKLSRYRPEGLGVPPETEATHFTHILEPYAAKHGMSFKDFVDAYNKGDLQEPELDEYFLHDRAVRESGHDTSYRLEKVCANLATIDLNSLLYKYEMDIAGCIRNHFGDSLKVPAEFCVGDMKPNHTESSAIWDRAARDRKVAMNKYLWNEKKGMFFDYDTVKQRQSTYETATTFWAMWSGLATPQQAGRMVADGLPLLEAKGGLASGTEKSRGAIGLDRPNRQWDYPYGWAPQQMLAWVGLNRYGYEAETERLAYKWLFMMTKAFVDYNGVVVEKYDVTRVTDPHRVDAEYGNQGSDFKGVATEGFGWVNASYVVGLSFMNAHSKRALGTLTPYEQFAKATLVESEASEETPEEESEEIAEEARNKSS